MTIKYAILGFLSWRALSGYDLRKLFSASGYFHWSGNNNQIYRTLLQLDREGLVVGEVQYADKGPSRKLYTITDAGAAELRAWVRSTPELPQFRKAFLVQLAWADCLAQDELLELLDRYADELRAELLMSREQRRRGTPQPARTPRETRLWEAIADNWISTYEHELAWVRALRVEFDEEKGSTA